MMMHEQENGTVQNSVSTAKTSSRMRIWDNVKMVKTLAAKDFGKSAKTIGSV